MGALQVFIKKHKAKLQSANDLLKVQGSRGNYDYDEYMRGMYNGMELIIAIMEDREPQYKEHAPPA